LFRELKDDLLSVFYPDLCLGCGVVLFKQEKHICLVCKINLPKTNFDFNDNNYLEKIFWGRISIEFASAFLYFSKHGLTQKLIHSLKYKNEPELGFYLGELFAHNILEKIKENPPDILTTVPLHPLKLKKRGYNQSDEIAKGLSKILNIEFNPNIIIRNKHTDTQTLKKRYNRWENTEFAFDLNPEFSIENKHVCIIDDVITTGATIEACGQEILKSKNSKVSFLSICVAYS